MKRMHNNRTRSRWLQIGFGLGAIVAVVAAASGGTPYPGPNAPSTETIIEAENFDIGGQGVSWNDTTLGDNTLYRAGDVDISNASPGPSGYHLTNIAAGEWVEYTIDVPQTCNYRIGVRVKAPTAGTSIQIDIGASTFGPTAIAANASWQFRQIVGTAALTAGQQVMRVTCTATPGDAQLDYITIVMLNGVQQPYPSLHTIPGVIEAENFDMGGPTISYVDSNLWTAGQRYRSADVDVYTEPAQPAGTYVVGSIVNNTEYLEYTVNVTEEAWYEIEYRYAVKNDTTVTKQFRVLMDGTDVTGTITIPNVSASNYGSAYTVNRYGSGFVVTNQKLTAGQHVMKIEWLAVANNVNLDYLKFIKYASEPQVPASVAKGFWRFDLEGGEDGTAASVIKDLSANGNDGTAVGSPVYDNEIPPARCQSSGGLTGKLVPNHTVHGGYLNRMSLSLVRPSGQYVTIPHSASLDLGDTPFTLEAWVSSFTAPNTSDPTTRQWVMQKKVADASENQMDYGLLAGGADLALNGTWGKTSGATGNEVVLVFGTGSGVETVVSNLEVQAGTTWYLLQVSYDPAKHEVVFLVNGKLDVVTGVVRSGTSTNSGPLYLGGGGTPGQFLDGWLDEVRISPFALPGTPTADGSLGGKKWFWNTEGTGAFEGMLVLENNTFTGPLTNYQPYPARGSRMYENIKSYWEVVPVAGEPGNYALRLHDHDEIDDAYLFWDNVAFSLPKEASTPQDLSNGATMQMRFKLNSFRDNGRQSSTNRVKFCRQVCYLKGAATANALFHWEMDYADPGAKTGISLVAGTETPPGSGIRWQSGNLQDGAWHTLHAVAYVVDASTIHQKTWLDGVLVEDFDRVNAEELTVDPILGFNDHLHPHQWTTEADFDYVRISGTGAWGPDGTPYSCGTPDLDGDGDVDGSDYGIFSGCFNGSGNPIGADCDLADLTCDGYVDGSDYGIFSSCFNGTGNPSPCKL